MYPAIPVLILEFPLDKEVQETAATEGGGPRTGRCGIALEVGSVWVGLTFLFCQELLYKSMLGFFTLATDLFSLEGQP